MEQKKKILLHDQRYSIGGPKAVLDGIRNSYLKEQFDFVTLEQTEAQGFIGCLLYVYLLVAFVKRQYKRYKVYSDRIILLFLFFGLIFIVDNVSYIFYTDIWLISFFILVATHSETYYVEKYRFTS